MRIISVLLALLFVFVFALSSYAVKPQTTPEEIEIVNTSPIPVTMTGPQKDIVSTNKDVATRGNYLIRTVPIDKQFVLTDILVVHSFTDGIDFFIAESGSRKMHVFFHYTEKDTQSVHFNSGIPFAPGAEVIIQVQGGGGEITISGYDMPEEIP